MKKSTSNEESQRQLEDLSRRERQFMDLIFRHGGLSAREIAEFLPDPPSNATVRSLLRILEEKGLLLHEKVGREFIYRPKTPAEIIRPNRLKQVLGTFFGGSLREAVATFINDPEADLSTEELDAIAALIERAREDAKG